MPSALRERYARFYGDTVNIERRYSLHDRYVAVRTFVHAIDYLRDQVGGFDVNLANAQMVLMDGIYNALDHRATGREWRNIRHRYNNERDGPYPPDPAEEDRRCDNCGGIRPKPFSRCHAKDHLPNLTTTRPDLHEQARQLVKHISDAAIELAFVRHSLTSDEVIVDDDADVKSRVQAEEEFCERVKEDTLNCLTGDDTGCLDPEELDESNCELLWTQALLNRVAAEAATAALEQAAQWQPMSTAPKDGTEVLLTVERRAGIRHGMLVGHYMPGGHCIEDHPAIDEGWYFWNGSMFDIASRPIRWMPLPLIAAIGDDKED